MINFWKFIDTNENYFHNFTIMQYGLPFLMNTILDYLGHLKNYNKIKAHVVNPNQIIANEVNVELKMNRLKITMQNSTSNQIIIVCNRCPHKILFSRKIKLVVSNILSFVRRKMLVKLSFCFLHAELFLLKNLFVLCDKTAIQATKNYNSIPLHATLERCKKCSTKISNKFC